MPCHSDQSFQDKLDSVAFKFVDSVHVDLRVIFDFVDFELYVFSIFLKNRIICIIQC